MRTRLMSFFLVLALILLVLMMAGGAQAAGTCGHVTVTVLSQPQPVPLGTYCSGPPCPLVGQGPNYIGWTSTNVQSYACVWIF